MLRTVASVASAVACLAAASPSQAQSFNSPASTFDGAGSIVLAQGVTIHCDLDSQSISLPSATTASLPSNAVSPGDFLCALATPFGTPWSLSTIPGSYTQVQMTFGFNFMSPCYGTIIADWDPIPRTLSFSGATLPGSSGCTVSGVIYLPDLQIV